ncbi:CAP domain-containing protein [Streptomyces sp. NPDC056527]|uniref:CAP domain-containing protein n=1 Tax=Streptomyces sp. NPDC056527 TaxID=3345853 RepID=UPI0036988FD5
MQHHDEHSPDERRTNGGGRHRRGRVTGRRARRAPSFRTAVTVAGTATAVLTVAAGAYVASLGSPKGAGTRPDTVALSQVAPLAEGAVPSAAPSSAPPERTPSTAPPAPRVSSSSSPSPAAPASASPSASAPPSTPAAPGPTPAQPKAAAPGPIEAVAPVVGKVVQYVDQIVSLANAEREKAGCSPLRSDGRLRSAAQAHADDMAERDYYEHTSPEGRDAGDRITAAGYAWSSWAENIHRGPKSPTAAMEDWMNSDGHRRNILNCSFKDIGVGVKLTSNGPWWVQNFGTGR